MSEGSRITDYLAYAGTVPVANPSLASALEWGFSQDNASGDLYFWDLHASDWSQITRQGVIADASTGSVGLVEVHTAPGGAHPIAFTTDDANVANGVVQLDGAAHVPLAQLSAITHSQLSGSAAITGSQLAAAAGIVAAQITSVNPSALTGSGSVPVGGLPVMVAAGGSHAAGIAPDPGSTTHSPAYYLGDDAAYHAPPTSYTLPDATTGAIGGVEIQFTKSGAHPVALTTDSLNVVSGAVGLDSFGRAAISVQGTLASPDTTAAFSVARTVARSGNAESGVLIYGNDAPTGGASTGELLQLASGGADRFHINQDGTLVITASEATTNANTPLASLGVISTGTPAAGFGGSLDFALANASGLINAAGRLAASWIVPTSGATTSRLALFAYDTTNAREGLRIDSSGSAAMLGFYGGSAVVKPTVSGSKGSNAALTSLMTALANLGLVTNSTT